MELTNIPDADDPPICSNCSGSGEGCADGTTCIVCHGRGYERPGRTDDREEAAIARAEAKREERQS